MKKLLLLSLFCAGFIIANAQLSDGSTAPDFTVYEIDKSNGTIISDNPYNLYHYLDSNKVVFLDFFATWCGPCWSFHQGGHFEDLYTQYGPEGTNEVMVFGIEADAGNYASLNGTGADDAGYSSQGNWLQGVQYPIIPTAMSPNTSAVANAYGIQYFPTVYMVCPSHLVYEIERHEASFYHQAMGEICRPYDRSVQTNGIIAQYSVNDEVGNVNYSYLCSASATPKIKLQNVGSNALTSAEFSITYNGQTTTQSWTGNLSQFAVATITLPQITSDEHGLHNYSVTLVSTNGVAEEDTVSNTASFTFFVSKEATSEDIEEDFSNLSYPWFIDDDTYFGIHTNDALFFNAYSASNGTSGSLYAPIMDISRFQVPVLKFDVAHRRYSTASERLQVQTSINCGSSWTTQYNKSGADLATVSGSTSSQFIPTASQWRTEVVDLSNIPDKTNVVLRFRFISGYGNLVWLDNVRVVEGLGVEDVETEELSVYPNPTTGMLYVNAPAPVREVQIFNLQGQLVRSESGDIHEISMFDLSDGLYVVKVFAENGAMTTQKIVKQ